MPLTKEPQPGPSRAPLRVLLADADSEARSAVQGALSSLGPFTVAHAANAGDLERLFFDDGPFDLVVCRADIGAGTRLLGRARSSGRTGSFIVYSEVAPWLRVLVSDCDDTILSSRVMPLENLSGLATGMLEASRSARKRTVSALREVSAG